MRTKKSDELILLIKKLLKKSPVVKAMFEEFNFPISEIDNVSIEFDDLDVSAKTKDKKIYIDKFFLEDGEFLEDMHYVVHELTHYLQQTSGEVREYPDLECRDYLDKPTEVEAFQYQVQYMKDEYGEDFAKEYVNDLIEFHELKGSQAKEIKDKLLGN